MPERRVTGTNRSRGDLCWSLRSSATEQVGRRPSADVFAGGRARAAIVSRGNLRHLSDVMESLRRIGPDSEGTKDSQSTQRFERLYDAPTDRNSPQGPFVRGTSRSAMRFAGGTIFTDEETKGTRD